MCALVTVVQTCALPIVSAKKEKGPRYVRGPFRRWSDLVAERALDLALQILGFALALLRFAFGAHTFIVGRLADRLLGIADGFVGEVLGFVLIFTHGESPWLTRGDIAPCTIHEPAPLASPQQERK